MKLLSNILLFFNGINLVIIFWLYINGYWFLIPLDILGVILILKFHFYVYKDDYVESDIRRKEFKKEWKYLGVTNDCYQFEVWKNKTTGEIIEI